MVGNWLFGDYFKQGVIEFVWELLLKLDVDGGFGFQEKDFWVMIYEIDDEVELIWCDVIGLKLECIM